MLTDPAELERLVRRHEEWRSSCLNLVAAEARASAGVRAFLSGDLSQRYADYAGRDLAARKYQGVTVIKEIETETEELARHLFRATYAELRPMSGHVAGNAVIMSLTQPGDTVFETGAEGGGHRLTKKLTSSPLVRLDVRWLPFDPAIYNIDLPRAVAAIREARPSLVILGSSNFLFPAPVRELAEVVHERPGAALAFDGSHVMGLLAGKRFQDPLREGADVLFGSTHKTFPGPPGGMILTDSQTIIDNASTTVYPGLVSNHQPARLPGLALAFMEMMAFGEAYADQVIRNAQALGAGLDRCGIRVVGRDRGFTGSHTILVQATEFGTSAEVADWLEQCNIIVTRATLPEVLGTHAVRFGVQELTRLGAAETAMDEIACLVAAVLRKEITAPEALARSGALASRFRTVHFCFGEV